MRLEELETFATGLDHPEGVAWDPVLERVIAGGEVGQIYAIGRDAEPIELARTGGFMFGMTVRHDGAIVACDFGQAAVVRLDPDGSLSRISTGTFDRSLQVPNFAAFDSQGNLYVTDSGTWGRDDGVIFRIGPDGRTSIWTADVPAFPNGCCMSLDGDALLVVESRARRVVRIPIADDGSAGTLTPIVDLTGSQPDGIALARDGTMFIGCYRPDRIWRVPPEGTPEVFLDDPDGVTLNQPANVAFIGPDLDRLAISSLGGWNIVAADPGVPGLPLRG